MFWKWNKIFNELDENWEEILIFESEVFYILEIIFNFFEKLVKFVIEYSIEENGSFDDVESDSLFIYYILFFKVIGVVYLIKI